ncbi:hypothetical protein F5Y00DRAFT_67944 [Daldinia vernicosa]|uniref:uncharacterized protein n=1 Tax=Daldinia vernicosa TaxID=114800 RepID=UPI0020077EC1|nr:uncharacterized protein F5Y00DRAFT_67944 [Daldinia vernicosa]KAI0849183.1 hypothetical protein F5Y00DRAFT_67944 [Daldinia vernicosa]
MGVDCGFGVYPSLSEDQQDVYEAFLKDEINPRNGEPLIQIIGNTATKNAYVFFNVGEGPIIPYRCEYFVRFESELVSRDTVLPYLEGVYLIARRYFAETVQFWTSGMSPAWIRVPNKNLDEGYVRTDHEYVYKMRRETIRLVEEEQERSRQAESGNETTS